eukprot:TRINITY_DN104749_c0_g1_i1.p1 TRINITY_DN104749_c0_g1~~TRINITY_DN104749_c0_g1_i1.p1  ORF type:complete len:209 (-),score=25.46 TRINITY_DN104749_c0_g1_i1:200-826(-)
MTESKFSAIIYLDPADNTCTPIRKWMKDWLKNKGSIATSDDVKADFTGQVHYSSVKNVHVLLKGPSVTVAAFHTALDKELQRRQSKMECKPPEDITPIKKHEGVAFKAAPSDLREKIDGTFGSFDTTDYFSVSERVSDAGSAESMQRRQEHNSYTQLLQEIETARAALKQQHSVDCPRQPNESNVLYYGRLMTKLAEVKQIQVVGTGK